MNSQDSVIKPLIPAHLSPHELTIKAIITAIFITAILAASNAYLALKVGTTIAASIPAAVISMLILRQFKKHNVLEINIVQTAASAGEGVAAAVSFVLPSLLIIGFWQHFDYWTTVFLVTLGGVLGVLVSVPIRRVMLNHLKLPFPEGTAVGNVIKASAIEGELRGRNLIWGGIVGGVISFLQNGFQVISDNLQMWVSSGKTWIFGMGLGFSPALIAAGYIVGLSTAITLLTGVVIGWVIGIPLLGLWHGLPVEHSAYDVVMSIWNHHLRYVGVGTMLIGGIWTLITLMKPLIRGIFAPMSGLGGEESVEIGRVLPRTERDIPLKYLVTGTIVLLVLIYCFLLSSVSSTTFVYALGAQRYTVAIIGTLYVLIGGFFIASICAYIGGLVGMTNTPLSGLLLITVLLISLFLYPIFKFATILLDSVDVNAAIAVVMIITTLVAIIGAISGENLQDLKAGQMVGATPWKQQVMLLVGVIVAALIVGPVLEILFNAYGIGGVFPRPGMSQTQMLQAPQASLIAAVAKGIFGLSLAWQDITVGIVIGVVGIIADEWMKTKGKRLPVLGVGIAIYLPPEVMLPVVIGGFVRGFAESRVKSQQNKDNANLLACGLVAGSALMGVILAIPFVILGSSDALKIVSENFTPIAKGLGVVSMVLLCVWLYRTQVKTP